MTDRPATALTGTADVPPAGLEPDAIGPAQDTIIGMANAAPAVSVGLTLAALAAAAAYAVGPIIVLTAIRAPALPGHQPLRVDVLGDGLPQGNLAGVKPPAFPSQVV